MGLTVGVAEAVRGEADLEAAEAGGRERRCKSNHLTVKAASCNVSAILGPCLGMHD